MEQEEESTPRAPEPRSSKRAAIAGLVVGLVGCGALIAFGVLTRPDPEAGKDRSTEFLAAYTRSRTGTYRMESSFRREMRTGAVLESAREVTQRMPNRLVRQFGGLNGQIDGRDVVCTSKPDGEYSCVQGNKASQSLSAELDEEITNLRSYFVGPRPLYRATRSGVDCFQLMQDYPLPDPPFGTRAEFCFDEPTGAVRRLVRDLDLANETVEAVTLTGAVNDSDFSLERDAEFDEQISRPEIVSATTVPSSTTTLPAAATTSKPSSASTQPPTSLLAGESGPSVPDLTRDVRSLVARCVSDPSGDNVNALWDSRVSVNERPLSATACGRSYVSVLFDHGFGPPSNG